MKHEITFHKDIRGLPPTDDGWRQIEPAGTCTITCSCGYDSGTIPNSDIARTASEHVGFDITRTRTTPE